MNITRNGVNYRLERTCTACPEQYDVLVENEQVGYLRLRHGEFRVEVPDVGGRAVYEAAPEGDGIFEDEERDDYLRQAVDAIHRNAMSEPRKDKPA